MLATLSDSGCVQWRISDLAGIIENSGEDIGWERHSTATVTTVDLCACLRNHPELQVAGEASDGGEVFTPSELSFYSGNNDRPIYLAIRRIVYDVSEGRSFYGPGCGYSVFAGHDATRNLATMSLDPAFLDQPDYAPIDDEERSALNGWITKLKTKYPKVGTIRDPKAHGPVIALAEQLLERCRRLPSSAVQLPGGVEPADVLSLYFASGPLDKVKSCAPVRALNGLMKALTASLDAQIISELEPFAKFERYDFDSDPTFQSGLKVVLKKMEGKFPPEASNPKRALLEAKAFYFNRFVDEFDLQAYLNRDDLESKASSVKNMSSSHCNVTDHSKVKQAAAATAAGCPMAEILNGSIGSATSCSGSKTNKDELKLSFEEVLDLVSQGKPVPGCRTVNVDVAKDQPPSTSVLTPPAKPWDEIDSAQEKNVYSN